MWVDSLHNDRSRATAAIMKSRPHIKVSRSNYCIFTIKCKGAILAKPYSRKQNNIGYKAGPWHEYQFHLPLIICLNWEETTTAAAATSKLAVACDKYYWVKTEKCFERFYKTFYELTFWTQQIRCFILILVLKERAALKHLLSTIFIKAWTYMYIPKSHFHSMYMKMQFTVRQIKNAVFKCMTTGAS